ncbi:MAG: hypothetical protein CL472_07945, partial [Acidobacteria bacterium]|nr:hypothetical protein [Acidobacteriota bacterium]
HAEDFNATLLRTIEQVQQSPRCSPVEVRQDFWQRFGEWERLEELRLSRPSAFKALPFAPGGSGENP